MARGSLLSAADVGHCPHRVALSRGAPPGPDETPPPTEILRRIRETVSHREHVVAHWRDVHPDIVVANGYDDTERLARDGAPLILHGRLADTGHGKRRSVFDLLVMVGVHDGRPRYAPVVIKNNEVTETASTRRLLEGSIERPSPLEATWTGGVGVRRNDTMRRNGLFLSHATRVLETFGLADPAHAGGIVDRHERLWWFDLDNKDWGRWRLAAYDVAYEQRLDIVHAHEAWQQGLGPFPTTAFWHRECPTCPFQERCATELEEVDDVSLVRFTSLEQQVLLREHQITTRHDLARLDPDRAAAARGKLLPTTDEHAPEELLGRSIDKLDELIYRARAVVRGVPLLKVKPDELSCPTADVEIDVDMESYDDVTYLWGAYVTLRRPIASVSAGYHAFVDWSPLSASVEAGVFATFWEFFDDVRRRSAAAGATFAAYCFWAQAENSAMNRAISPDGTGRPTLEEIDQFRHHQPSEWIDLHDVVKSQLQTDGPLGLKSLAKAAGFEWRDENPSGEASMTWYEDAVSDDIEKSGAARQRLLAYNEDDCRATRALREWLNSHARSLPSRDVCP